MIKQPTIYILTLFILSACSSAPPEAERSAVSEVPVNQISADSSEVSDEPSATVEVIIQAAEPEPVESYPSPEPEAVVAEAYPEPEEGYPEPDDQVVQTSQPIPAPDIAGAGDVDVLFVSARLTSENVWSFSVTLEHEDTGWEDYADGWDVVLPDGTVLKPDPNDPFTRLLLHPHENEQPFTRSQSGIDIPADVTTVFVRAHETVEGYGASVVAVDLTAPSGDRFEVQR